MVQICSTCYEKHSSRAEGVQPQQQQQQQQPQQQATNVNSSAAEKVTIETVIISIIMHPSQWNCILFSSLFMLNVCV